MPETVGGEVFVGPDGVTTVVWAETAVTLPAPLVAMTATRTVWPTSAGVSV